MTDATTSLERLKKRPEYLAVSATGRKWVTPSFILQARPGSADSPPAIGFTVSKKVGKAVIRSRVRRRLKEAARIAFPKNGGQGWQYVLIGRQAAKDYPFEKLCADMKWALAKLSSGADLKPNGARKPAKARNAKKKST